MKKSEYYFDEDAAKRAILFFEKYLRHTKGKWAGQAFKLLPWQKEIIWNVFGWKRSDGFRRYRTVYIEVPRKAGKSTLAAGIALYLLYADGEIGAEVYSAAVDRMQAGIVFETAKQMVIISPELRKQSQIFKRSIVVPSSLSTYQVLSADAPSKHGLNSHGIIFDELHAQPDRELWDILTTSVGAREQPLIVAITTAGYDRESICWELHEYARRVKTGIVRDDSFYPAIFAAEEKDDWTKPETWRKANPSLGITVKEEFYHHEIKKALEMPAYENTVRRLYLNQWSQQINRWISLELWDENAGTVDEEKLKGQTCYGGLDLSSVSDMTAWVMVFPHEDDKEAVDVVCRFWVPEAQLHNNQNRYRDQYQKWAKQGWLQTTPGDAVDYSFIKAQILQDAQNFKLVDFNIDRLFQAHQLAMELTDEGLTVIGLGQGFLSMAVPVKEFERRLLARKINHGGNPVLKWMADNVAVKQDPAGNLKVDKANSQGKVDGIVALIMALDRAMRREQTPRSVYEERGIINL